MGELRWRVALPSWAAILIGGVLTLMAVRALASTDGVHPITVGVLAVGLALLVPGAVLRLDVGDDGIAVWPTGPKVRWDDIEGFERTGLLEGTISIYRRDVERPTPLNFQPVRRRKAGAVIERLDAELHR